MGKAKDQTTKPSLKPDRDPDEPLKKSGTAKQPSYDPNTGSGAASGDPTE